MNDNELEEIRQVMFVLRHRCDDINKVEEAVIRIEELQKDLEYVASMILSSSYTEKDGLRIMDGNEYIWIDAAVETLKKYHKRKKE